MDKHITQNQANLTRVSDVLQKTTYEAPFDGVITNLPVREGETVVIGIQNSPGSTLMTIADMSVITSEVKVDETDIVNVHLGQSADVTIDAIPHKVFHGMVSEIGDNAIVRSTGVATSQATSTSEEAKDFKVVVTLTDPPAGLAPGAFVDRQDHDRDPQQRAEHSDSGAHGPHSGGSGAEGCGERHRCEAASAPDRRIEAEGRDPGRVRDPQQEGGVRSGGYRHQRHHRHRSHSKACKRVTK